MKLNNKLTWTIEDLKKAIKSSFTIADTLRKLGLAVRPGNYKTIHKYIKIYNLDITHFTGKAHGTAKTKKFTTKEILVKNSPYSSNNHLKKRLIKEGILHNKCSICGINSWLDKKIICVLDHINGDNTDNRLTNLRMLCPNCNSQQDTFCRGHLKFLKSINGKEKYKKIKHVCSVCNTKSIYYKSKMCMDCYHKSQTKNIPTKKELLSLIWTKPTTHLAKDFGVSDKAIEKWCKKYNIEKPNRGYWTKYAKIAQFGRAGD